MGVPVTRINKIGEGSPHVVDLIRERRCDLVINTPTGSGARADGYEIRTAAVRHGIPCVTTMTGASAAVRAIAAQREGEAEVRSLQEIHAPPTRAEQASMTRPVRAGGSARSTENRASGGYRVFSLLDREGPEPRAGPVLHARHRATTGRSGGQRPFLPRALSVAEAATGDGRRPARLPDRGDRPGHRPALRAGGGRAGLGQRPARQRLLGAARAGSGRRRGDPGRRRHRHRAAGPAAPPLRRAQRPDPRPARLPRRGPLGRPRRPLPLLRGSASPARTATSATGLRHRPARR